MNNRQVYILFGAFALAGSMALCFGCQRLFNVWTFVSRSYTTEGNVVGSVWDYKSSYNPSRGLPREWNEMASAEVTFISQDGETVKFVEPTSFSKGHHFHKGDRVRVVYDPQTKAARIKSFKTLWLIPLALTMFGVLFSGLGIGMSIALAKGKLK